MGPLFSSLPRLRAGASPSIEDLVQTINQLSAALDSLRGLKGDSGLTLSRIGNSPVVQDLRPRDFLLRVRSGPAIGSGSATCGYYLWEAVSRQGCDYIVSGPSNSLPAYEINGNPNVPDGTVCRAWLAGDGRAVEFEYCCGDLSGSDSGTGSTPTVYRTDCINGINVRFYSVNGGSTWIFDSFQGCCDCGGDSGSGSGGGVCDDCTCDTEGGQPDSYNVTFGAAGNVGACDCSGVDGTYGFAIDGTACRYSSILPSVICGATTYSFIATLYRDGPCSWKLSILGHDVADSSGLFFVEAVYEASTWHCFGSNTMTKIEGLGGGTCDWPDTISVVAA